MNAFGSIVNFEGSPGASSGEPSGDARRKGSRANRPTYDVPKFDRLVEPDGRISLRADRFGAASGASFPDATRP